MVFWENGNMSMVKYPPIRSIYALAVFFGVIVIMAFVWYGLHLAFGIVSVAGHNIIYSMGTNSTLSDNVEIFFSSVDTYMLIVILILGLIWVLRYSQEKGSPYGV